MSRIGNTEIQDIIRQYPTPLYVYDEGFIRRRMQEFKDNFVSDKLQTEVIYASKAFNCKAMVRLVQEYDFGLDVVSGGEMYTALRAGFDASHIYFHGNNKTLSEMEMALTNGVGTIVVDNLHEAKLLSSMCTGEHKVHTLLRVNPGIEAHTHQYIVTAHVDSKFGISLLQEEELLETVHTLTANPNIVFDGLHAHIGSQIFDARAFREEVHKMFAIAKSLHEKYGLTIRCLNFGGGFAARYTDKDAPIPVAKACQTIIAACEEEKAAGAEIEKVMIEPGRSIVAEAGCMLYTVGACKKTPNREYLFVNGGMSDNIRPALYQAEYDAYIDGKEGLACDKTYTIAGKCCESGDILIQSIALPEAKSGDTLVVRTTGAYGYSMASNYNKLPRPGVVFVNEGNVREVIKAETYEDLIAREI